MTLSVKTTLEYDVLKMAHQQGASVSLRAGGNEESEGELPLCWSSSGVFTST